MKNTVNLKKALAEIRQWPGARTDRKVFTTIASHANDKGVAKISLFTIAMAIRKDRNSVYESVFRLGKNGFVEANIEEGIYPPTRYGNPFDSATFTIAPAYMLHTEDNTGNISALTDSVNNAAKSIRRATNAYIDFCTAYYGAYAKACDKLTQQLNTIANNLNHD